MPALTDVLDRLSAIREDYKLYLVENDEVVSRVQRLVALYEKDDEQGREALRRTIDIHVYHLLLTFAELHGVASPTSLEFLTELRSLMRLCITGTALDAEVVSLRALENLTALHVLELVGGRKSLRNLVHLEALGALRKLGKLHMHHGPKEVDTIRWVRDLRELTAFRLQGTRIRAGDLTPLLRLPHLRDVTINPIAKHYSHSPALFHIEMQQHRAAAGTRW